MPAPLSGALDDAALVDYFVRIASVVTLPVMIQDAPAYLGVRLGAGVVQRIAAAAENVRLVKLEAGPAEMLTGSIGSGTGTRSGAGTAACTCSTAFAAAPPGSSPASTSSTCSSASTRQRHAGELALADERLREILPMLVFEMQHSIDHYNACAKDDTRSPWRARARRTAPARSRAR